LHNLVVRTFLGITMRFFTELATTARSVAKRPANWLATAIFALVLGANSALYGVLDFLTTGPLGFTAQERLVSVHNSYPAWDNSYSNVSIPDFVERKRDIAEIEDAAIFYGIGGNLALPNADPVRLVGLNASTTFFSTVGWRAALGRVFVDSDGIENSAPIVVLSDRIWRTYFNSDASIVGRLIELNGAPRQVVGVLPASAVSVDQNMGNDYFLPAQFDAKELSDEERGSDYWRMFARLKPGANPNAVAQKATQLFARYAKSAGVEREKTFVAENQGAAVQSLRANIHGDALKNASLLMYAVLGVLLIACANIANVLSAQVIERGRELAVRSAIGAPAGRIFVGILLEGVLIAGVAAVLGVLLAHLLLPIAAQQLLGASLIQPTLSAKIFLLSLLLGIVSGVLASLLAAWVAMRAPLSAGLRVSGRSMSASADLVRLRRWVSGVQIALAIALLAGSLALVRDFARRDAGNNGFVSTGVQTMKFNLSGPSYKDQLARNQFLQALDSKLRALPGVAAMTLSQHLPFNGNNWNSTYTSAFTTREEHMNMVITGPGMFDTLRIPLKAGRDFVVTDARDAGGNSSDAGKQRPDVVILDEQAAMTLLGTLDVVGKSVLRDKVRLDVVGLVGNVERVNPGQASANGSVYMPSYQVGGSNETHIALRPTPGAVIDLAQIRAVLATLNPGLPLFDVRSLDDMRQSQLQPQRLVSNLSGAFSLVALLLAMVGTFGVMAFAIERRRNEFGVRQALGASQSGIVTLVLKDAAGLLAIGASLGLPLAFGAQTLLAERLNSQAQFDGMALALALSAIFVAALCACALPALRARAISPVVAMRAE
jgi:putative ABC transport system permease protein